MHPAIFLVPAAVLVFGPRLWVKHVLKKHSREDEAFAATGADLARELLDRHQLQAVKVELTDTGDHYDSAAKTVRLTRDKFERKSLTGLTSAAHEVSHALQDASGYRPFLWRSRLVKVAQVTGQLGSVIFVAAPATALLTRQALPSVYVGVAFVSMLGTGLAVQLASVPTELDASFSRALPMLRNGYINGEQENDAKRILFVCSFSYVASSLVAFLSFLPWLGRGVTVLDPRKLPDLIARRRALPESIPVGGQENVLPPPSSADTGAVRPDTVTQSGNGPPVS